MIGAGLTLFFFKPENRIDKLFQNIATIEAFVFFEMYKILIKDELCLSRIFMQPSNPNDEKCLGLISCI